jgi:hypothetical protein
MDEWILDNKALLWWLGIGSAAMFVATLAAIPVIVARMPVDYFTSDREPLENLRGRHPAIRVTALILKNMAGAIFMVMGIAMLLGPGQGVLCILIGLSLLDFPGKRRLQLRIARRKVVLRAINWIRKKAHRPPIEVPPAGRNPR